MNYETNEMYRITDEQSWKKTMFPWSIYAILIFIGYAIYEII